MTELTKSAVVFDKATHTYVLEDRLLKGVTPIVKWMYPDTYKDIPQEVLNKAAEHGSLIHSKCELYDAVGIDDTECPQLTDYIALKERYGLQCLCSEYLVSDNEYIASSIDKVYKTDKEDVFDLADIKTTSAVHIKNVTLQLSIYAWLFEKNNPDLKVGRLQVVWLPKAQYGKADVIEVKRISVRLCEKIVEAFVNGEDSCLFPEMIDSELGATTEVAATEEMLPASLADVEEEIINIENRMKECKARSEELRAGLLEQMIKHNVKKWKSDRLLLTRKEDSVRESVDSAKLKKQFPDVYKSVLKRSAVKGGLMIKIA